MSYIKNLTTLRRKLAGDQLSLLVGSGFSKNVSPLFLTWDELLHDLVCELYKDEIGVAFDQHCLHTPRYRRLLRQEFVRDKAKAILRAEGYLQVVSKFISIKGYAESIAGYIEERTPQIIKKHDELYLLSRGATKMLPREQLALHLEIINLPWNNIYTTNYDELLDVCIDPDIIPELQHKIMMVERELDDVDKEIILVRKALEALKNDEGAENSAAAILVDAHTRENPKRNVSQERFDLGHRLQELGTRKEEKEKQVRDLERSVNESYRVVTHAADLKLKRNRNIVKLHGSLRTKAQKESHYFEFDGDFKTQYIIAAEHYNDYPVKHEAFTQLMRLSLLQESFCLIGFSGVDPNFLAWIGWVRDILQKQAAKPEGQREYKIYLIDVNNTPDTVDKRLFYENHSIIRIPIREPEILKFIAPPGTDTDSVDPRAAIGYFLAYLSGDYDIRPIVPLKDLSAEQDRRRAWTDLHFKDSSFGFEIASIKKTVSKLEKLRGKVLLPDINHAYSRNQHEVLRYARSKWPSEPEDTPEIEQLSRLVLYALQDYFVPIREVLPQEVIDALLRQPATAPGTKQLLYRYDALTGIAVLHDGPEYEQVLYLAYTLQFDKLRSALDAWQPQGRQVLQKAGFMAVFDLGAASALLTEELENGDRINGEERLYAYEMLSHFKLTRNWHRDKKLDRITEAYEQSGFRPLRANYKYLQSEIVPKDEKITPYGKGRFSTGSSVHFITFTAQEMSSQYLGLLAELGNQMALRGVYLQSPKDFYPVFKLSFERYPFPCLYHCIQHQDTDFLKRIGQDYAASEILREQRPRLCQTLFAALKTAPVYLHDHIRYVLSELLIAVKPAFWENSFLDLWKALVLSGEAFKERDRAENAFFTTAIKHLRNRDSFVVIIRDCLEHILSGKSKIPIDYLFYLNSNAFYKHLRNKKQVGQQLHELIEVLIDELTAKVDSHLFALGNLYRLLTPEQHSKISAALQLVDYSTVRNVRVWRIILHFVKPERNLMKRIRQALLSHYALWYTGIEGTTISGGIESIDVSALTKGPENAKGITWTAGDLDLLYKKIKDSLRLIKNVGDRPLVFNSFANVLEDMIAFMRLHRHKLGGKADYAEVMQLASALFDEQREYKSLTEGLLSADSSAVIWALSEVSRALQAGQFDPQHIIIIINKALLQQQPGLEASLNYLAHWGSNTMLQKQFELFAPWYILLLEKYLDKMPDNVDVPYVQERLVMMALQLQKWGTEHAVVEEWLLKAKLSDFNNVQQLLMR
ncbi:SIR2 family protein [Mucilaginibacter defluvii]|uniref:SIR2-like protein n=1 Tax=Mucilaginibacter defluvii TaxID=1196019 RepID=A0ABP9FS62_9SPHI